MNAATLLQKLAVFAAAAALVAACATPGGPQPSGSDIAKSVLSGYSLGGADWIVGDEAKGPEEIVGTFNLQPILKKSEANYSEFVGVDRHVRQ